MKITRRLFALVLVISSVAALTLTLGARRPAASTHYLAFVGTYTNKTESKGIYAFDFDSSTGKLTLKGVVAETPDPSWVAIHPSGKFAYAANEAGEKSTITAFAVDATSAKLTQLNQLSAFGQDPCHLSFDKTDKYLFVANYSSGNVVVFPILPDGKLGEHTANVKDAGTLGPNKERQEGPHAHWIQASQDGASVYVADLGLDQVFKYQFDSANGKLSGSSRLSHFSNRQYDPSVRLDPGTGPRHAVVSSNGMQMYVLGELQSTVTAFHLVGTDDYVPTAFQRISTLPKGFSGRNDTAEITIHPNGKFLFASNRGHDSIAVFSIDPAKGTLTNVGTFSTGGKEPRHFAIDPTGGYLLAENQNSNSIVVFHIDPATGALTKVSQADGIPSPVCLAFAPNP
jgi:6-phosphogluconolactonase